MARMITFFGPLPVTMKPPMPTLSPVRTRMRVEKLTACAGGLTPGVTLIGVTYDALGWPKVQSTVLVSPVEPLLSLWRLELASDLTASARGMVPDQRSASCSPAQPGYRSHRQEDTRVPLLSAGKLRRPMASKAGPTLQVLVTGL